MLLQKMLKRLFGSLTMFSAILLWSVGALAAPPAVISGDVNVINTPDVNVANTPDVSVVRTPYWQGTPVVITNVILGEGCEEIYVAEEGKALLLSTVVARFNMELDGSASTSIKILALGAEFARTVGIPTFRTSDAFQFPDPDFVLTNYEQYNGSVNFQNFPVLAVEHCVSGFRSDPSGGMQILGFEVSL